MSALLNAVRRAYGVEAHVEAFDEYALGSGTEAAAMACVRLRVGAELGAGVAFAADTTSAALQAVLTALPPSARLRPLRASSDAPAASAQKLG